MPKVYVVMGHMEYYDMFKQEGYEVLHNLVKDIPDLVCFTGGSDVSPSFYGEDRHPQTYIDRARDETERDLFHQFVEAGIPMVGICRGGQFLNVMNGGKMYQHVSNHITSHLINDIHTGETVLATSTHHQMMRPGISGKIVAIANQNSVKQHMKGGKVVTSQEYEPDVECVFYPHTQSLCFQPHPEFGSASLKTYFFNLINRYIKGE